MSSTLMLNIIWVVESLLYLALAVRVLQTGNQRRWPSLVAYSVTYSLGSGVLAFLMSDYASYFWFFWEREFALALLRIWIVIDLFRSLPAGRHIPRGTVAGTVLAATMLAILGWYAAGHNSQLPLQLTVLALINRCAATAWAGSVIALVAGIGFSGFAFRIQAVRIGTGYIILVISGMLSAMIYSLGPSTHLRIFTNETAGLVDIGVLLYWLFSISSSFDPANLNPRQASELSGFLKTIHKSFVATNP